MRLLGFIVNPVAGMGGSVGLKGTDGDLYKKAIEMGATPIAPKRVEDFLINIKNIENILLIVAPGKMGEDYIKNKGFKFKVIGEIDEITTAEDTKRITKLMLEEKIDLLVFCGGDGTARDIFDSIDLNIPVVAIPSGVKMFSSAFAINPKAAAQIVDMFIEETTDMQEREILDIDEDAYRNNRLDSKLYGYLLVPKVQNLTQSSKEGSKIGRTEEENKLEIAQQIIETMEEDTLYLLGPGTTVKSIAVQLKLNKSILGVDAVFNKNLIGEDLNESNILSLLDTYPKVKIIVTPIGGQGFVFGRGNKQFTPEILKRIGKKNIIIISTEEKIKSLKRLLIDTGDIETDELLKGFAKVVIGYKEEIIVEIEC